MDRLRHVAGAWPVSSFVVLAYALTWIAWWPIPWLAGGQTGLTTVLMGVMVGPGAAAVLLDPLLHGRNTALSARAVVGRFVAVFLLVLGVDLWILATPHPVRPAALHQVEADGWSLLGVVSALLSATVVGGVFAAASSSRTRVLATLGERRLPPRWYAIALLFPAAVFGIALAMTALAGGQIPASPVSGVSAGLWVPYTVRAVLYTLLVVAIGEEVGWRGFMLPRLLTQRSPLAASIVIGVVWAFWHLPAYLEGHLYGGGLLRVFSHLPVTIPLAIVFTWLFIRTGGHLLPAVLLHTAVNNTPRLIPATAAMMPVFLAIVIVLIVAGRMWRRLEPVEERDVGAVTQAT